ncbi:protein kinase family protein [Streptosporangium sp. KLBMP 9127]|nr:serine/threonine protein kinase [Streptosporangium sp. KLBMP 9127]
MSAPAVEPGTKLADRFRLEDRVTEQGGATLWKAIDEVLARPVAVHTFTPEFPRVSEVVTAARTASRLSDPRLTQVFDAAEEDGRSYVVSEWVTGETLADLLSAGPLDPERAAGFVAEAAEALVHAHEAGLAHLCLTPDRLIWTSGSTVKVLGLGVDAALAGLESDDPARTDAEGLGRLLYAGLTGHWPGGDESGLPAAPMTDSHVCTPRQVTAGVPGYLDTITCRAVIPEARRGLTPLANPAEVADALGGVPRPTPVAVSAVPPSVPIAADEDVRFEMTRPRPEFTGMIPAPRPPHKQGGMVNRVLMAAVVLLVMAAVGLGAWTLGRNIGSPGDTQAESTPTPSVAVEPKIVKAESASGFDPLGDDREEHPELARFAIDGKPDTEWHTTNYNSADLGRLKDGVGLLLDMGKPVKVADVIATLSKASGATVELKVGDSRELSSLKTVARQRNVSGKVTLTPETAASGQYVLIWFTRLPMDQGKFRGTIYDVVVSSTGTA